MWLFGTINVYHCRVVHRCLVQSSSCNVRSFLTVDYTVHYVANISSSREIPRASVVTMLKPNINCISVQQITRQLQLPCGAKLVLGLQVSLKRNNIFEVFLKNIFSLFQQ